MKKVRDILISGMESLKEKSDTARLDTEIIICHVLGWDRVKLMLGYDEYIGDDEERKIEELMEKRRSGMPIAYIINEKEFMGYSFYVDENVLIPRPDTEVTVEAAFRTAKSIYMERVIKNGDRKNRISILDMCSGSGAIIISICRMFEEFLEEIGRKEDISLFGFYGADISEGALKVAVKNSEITDSGNVDFIRSDLFSSDEIKKLKGKLDILVSNPPYIEEDVIKTLKPDVKDFEPFIALSGGKTGMDFYNRIIEGSTGYIKKGGYLIFESGHDQAGKICEKMKETGFSDIHTEKDIQGFERMICGKLTEII